jgi:DNA-binding transcriptional MerR regulator
MGSESKLPTIGAIAERLGQPLHRIRYVLDTRHIQPTGRAGNAKVYSDGDVERVRVALAQIDGAKEVGHG